MIQPMVSPSDRLLMAMVFALVVHAGLIFGVRFKMPAPAAIEQALDVELIEPLVNKPPQVAHYRAPAASEGSSTQRAKPKPPALSKPQPKASSARPKQHQPQPLTQVQAQASVPQVKNQEEKIVEPRLDRNLLARQIAELGVAQAQKMRLHDKERVIPIRQVSAYKHIAAAYEHAWQEKVERIGNLNYPEEARRKRLSGALLLSVWVTKDGRVKAVKVHRSSGYPVLDEAAVRIVHLAAPFPPFPLELAKQADQIVITRTWKFYDETGLAMEH